MTVKRAYLAQVKRLARAARARRFGHVERMIRTLAAVRTPVRILDAGGIAVYWAALDPALAGLVEITLVNRADADEAQDTPLFRADRRAPMRKAPPGLVIESRPGDACAMPEYDDDAFDLVHSSSVIQHVGGHDRRVAYAREIRRIGRAYFVQSPNVWFPIEPHYGLPLVQFLPSATRAGMLHRGGLGYLRKPDSYETALAMTHQIEMGDYTMVRELFPEALIVKERSFLMTKSFLAIHLPDRRI